MRRRLVFALPLLLLACKSKAPPAPAPAASTATPAGGLVPTRALTDAPHTSHLAFVDTTLLAWGKRSARAYAKDATTPTAKLDLADGELLGEAAGSLLLGVTGGKITAWDGASLERKWALDGTALLSAARAGDTVVARVAGAKDEIVGVDAASGAVKWRDAAEPAMTRVFAAGDNVVVGGDGLAALVDARTGKAKWSKQIPGSRPVAADATYVVTAWQSSHVWDTTTGDDHGELTSVVRQFFTATIEGSSFYGLVFGSTQTRLFGYDLVARKELWTASRPHPPRGQPHVIGEPATPDYREDLLVDNDAIYVAAGDGFLYGIERANGRQRWSFPVYGGAGLAVRHTPKTSLYVTGPESVLVFEEGVRRSEKATIHGTVTVDGKPAPGFAVLVDAQRAKTDAKGTFSTTVDAMGAVRIAVEGPDAKNGCTTAGEKIAELSEKGTYDVAIHAETSCAPR